MASATAPTPAQARVIRQFNGDTTAHDGYRPPTGPTYAICVRNGWIEPIEAFPFHRTTEAGLATLSGSTLRTPDAAADEMVKAAEVINVPTGWAVLAVDMRTVRHYAIEGPRGIACQCGTSTFGRDQLAKAHQRTASIVPGVRVLQDFDAAAAQQEAEPETASATNEINVGDTVRGRDRTGGHQTLGVVTAIYYPRGLGHYQEEPNDRPAHERVYKITIGKTCPDGGPIVTWIECAEKIPTTASQDTAITLDAEDAEIEAADEREARRTGGTFAKHFLGPQDGWDGSTIPSPAAPGRVHELDLKLRNYPRASN